MKSRTLAALRSLIRLTALDTINYVRQLVDQVTADELREKQDAIATAVASYAEHAGFAGDEDVIVLMTALADRALDDAARRGPTAEQQLREAKRIMLDLVQKAPCSIVNGFCRAHGTDAMPCPHGRAKMILGLPDDMSTVPVSRSRETG